VPGRAPNLKKKKKKKRKKKKKKKKKKASDLDCFLNCHVHIFHANKKNIYYSKITLHSRGFIFTDILRDKELCIYTIPAFFSYLDFTYLVWGVRPASVYVLVVRQRRKCSAFF
jgi:hypothetical protein